MNNRSKISLAAIAALSTVAALASAQQACPVALNDGVPLGSAQNPVTCQRDGVLAEAFGTIRNGQLTLFVDMIGAGASFADTFGYDANGDRLDTICQALDTDEREGVGAFDEDPGDCVDAVRQDLEITDNEG